MKKIILSLMAFAAVSSAFAGGLLTNTNQNAAFVRNFAQEGKIDLTSIYANPAGGAFLEDGWHLSLNSQTAFQQRNIETTFPLFQYNIDNPNPTHLFEGKATAPVVPSFTVSYNKDRWNLSAHFAISGGGGKCEFDNGIGSFEAAYAGVLYQMAPSLLPTGVNYQGYSLNSYMKGRSYHFGLQIGGAYKFTEKIAGYVGVRALYANANYNGFVNPSIKTDALGIVPLNNYGIDLNCDQTGFGATVILGVDYKINDKWNVSAKYECPTRLNLKNKSEINIAEDIVREKAATVLGQFEDGKKVREDVPALLALGAQYSPIEKVRLCASYHQFFDKVSTKYLDKQELIDHNTHEFILGAEYDINKLLTISGSWEITRYGLSDEYMNDLSYSLSNNMVGGGVRIHATNRLSIDLGYMCTFYNDREVTTQTAAGPKKDVYSRKNHSFGIGVNLDL
ncbi:MAG: outer membrane protein transport protein [Bacteroidaceae bacterium]|nr:outer membrane protein transport protein [Bacteroidaceae bacterium]